VASEALYLMQSAISATQAFVAGFITFEPVQTHFPAVGVAVKLVESQAPHAVEEV